MSLRRGLTWPPTLRRIAVSVAIVRCWTDGEGEGRDVPPKLRSRMYAGSLRGSAQEITRVFPTAIWFSDRNWKVGFGL